MSFNGTVVGSPTFSAAKFGNGLTATSDSNYITLPTGVYPPAAPVTMEAWLKTTAAGTEVALSCHTASGNTNWIGVDAGTFRAAEGINLYDSGITISDGLWHHCAVVYTATQVLTFVDGVAGNSFSVSFSEPSLSDMFIGRYETSGFAWSGAIDEVAIWTIQKYSGSYTVPTAPYAGTESGLQALYHLQSDGTDSTSGGGGGTTIDPSNSGILYSPFNWNVVTGQASTINSGAYFRTIFSGTSAAIAFDTSPNASPYPEVWARVDNQAWTLLTLTAGSPTLPVATGLDNSKHHMLEVVIKATSEFLTRWSSSQTVVQVTGIVLDPSATVTTPTRRTKNVLIFGDSITEGYHVYGSGDVTTSDALGCYSYALTTALDAEVGVVGFGGQGVTVGGQGGVPDFPSAYNLLYDGVSRSFNSPAPDLVIYNQGTNDTSSITSGLTTVISAILTAAPSSKHLILVPFNGTHASEIAAVVSGLALAALTSVSTTGWFNTADSVDGVHPYNYASVDFIAPLLFPQVMAALYPSSGGGSSEHSFVFA
jgi:Concanavalin A-like lectin/glucanases superfamily